MEINLFSSFSLISLLLLICFLNAIQASKFPIEEATVKEIQLAFVQNKLTSKQLVIFYLEQIQALNPRLRSVVEINPDALDQAEKADRERERNKGRRSLGKLHGIPVLLKDSIGTKDKLNTTCGSYALLGSEVERDAGVVERLRNAGAVILGKASQTEWYGSRSLEIPDAWCARAGQGVVSTFPALLFFFLFFFFMNYHLTFTIRFKYFHNLLLKILT